MNINSIPPLLASVAYIPLLVIFLMGHNWKKKHALLIVYLISAMVWSLSSFFLRSDFFPEYKLLFFNTTLCGLPFTATFLLSVINYHTHKPLGKFIYPIYALLVLFFILTIINYIPTSVVITNGVVAPTFSIWFYVLTVVFFIYPIALVVLLIRKFMKLTNPVERNIYTYFIITIVFLAAGALAGLSPIGEIFPISHFANLVNAIILTAVIIKGEMVSVALLARRTLAFCGLVAVAIVIYLVLYTIVRLFLDVNPKSSVLALAVAGAVIVGMLFLMNHFLCHSFI